MSDMMDGEQDFEVWPDFVRALGKVILRYPDMPASAWLDYWVSRHGAKPNSAGVPPELDREKKNERYDRWSIIL